MIFSNYIYIYILFWHEVKLLQWFINVLNTTVRSADINSASSRMLSKQCCVVGTRALWF